MNNENYNGMNQYQNTQFANQQMNFQNYNGQPTYIQTYQQPMNQNNKTKNKNTTILLVTNIITFVLLIGLILTFIFKDTTTECLDTNKGNDVNQNTNGENIKEDNSYESTATTTPVSNDWTKYQFSVKGKTLSLPCSYLEFKDISGMSMKSAEEKSFSSPDTYALKNLYIENGTKYQMGAYVDIQNDSNIDMQNNKLKIISISQDEDYVTDYNAPVITFPGGLKVGMEFSKEKTFELFGETDDVSDYNSENYHSITITYEEEIGYFAKDYYQITIVNGIIDRLNLRKFIR